MGLGLNPGLWDLPELHVGVWLVMELLATCSGLGLGLNPGVLGFPEHSVGARLVMELEFGIGDQILGC